MVKKEDNQGNDLGYTFFVTRTGEIHMNGTVFNHTEDAHHRSVLTGDSSVYIGSGRFSYDRSSHKITLHRLKQNHIPTYLQQQGVTTQDITGQLNDMTIIDWINFARDHLNTSVTASELFPVANHAADWEQMDAPVPTLQSWATGADQDITTLESEMDAAEVRPGLCRNQINCFGANPAGVSALQNGQSVLWCVLLRGERKRGWIALETLHHAASKLRSLQRAAHNTSRSS